MTNYNLIDSPAQAPISPAPQRSVEVTTDPIVKAYSEYSERGWHLVPIFKDLKGPTEPGWGSRTWEADDFKGATGIGMVTGPSSNDVVEVDLDDKQRYAHALAPNFSPKTGMISGREGNPLSHYWYRSPGAPHEKFKDPVTGEMLLELRGNPDKKEIQTVIPPSVCEGKRRHWDTEGEPATVDAAELHSRAALVAAGALICRNAPKEHGRHNFGQALSGFLRQGGMSFEDAEFFIRGIVTAINERHGEGCVWENDWLKSLEDTDAKIKAGEKEIAGRAALITALGDKGEVIVKTLVKWLGLKSDRKGHSADGLIKQIVGDAELFHTADGVPAMTVTHGAGRRTFPIRSSAAREYITWRAWQTGGMLSDNAIKGIQSTLSAAALFDGAEQELGVRVMSHNGRMYIDLGTDAWDAVEIDATGWRIVATPPVRFYRPAILRPLPTPVVGGSLDDLAGLLNIEAGSWPLIRGFLVGCFLPSGGRPALNLVGEQGSGKSTVARMLKRLIDPSKAELRSEPHSDKDLMIYAQGSLLIGLDNLSGLARWLSDALCRLSTGGSSGSRMLYANDEEFVFEAQRPVVITSIGVVATQPDLLSRMITVTAAPIADKQRRTEDEVMRDFTEAQPRLLGALYGAISAAMRHHASVRLSENSRMADWTKWVVASEGGNEAESAFISAYKSNGQSVNAQVLEESPIAQAIIDLLGRQLGGIWEGTASELLNTLEECAAGGVRYSRDWPDTPRALSVKLQRLVTTLRAEGIDLVLGEREGKARKRIIRVARLAELTYPFTG